MPVSISGTNGVTFPDSSLQAAAASPYVLKNRIINGDFRIDQRNAGASGTGGGYTVDRFQYAQSQTSKFTWQQNAGSVTPPVGFKNYLGFTSSSAYSVLATDYFFVSQPIEGFNVADLAWGTASAKTVTLSFQVYSSLTGTFGGAIRNSAGDRNYPFSYTVSSANTWATISITIAGDTTGTWLSTNGIGIQVYWGLGVGSTYSGTAGAWSGTAYLSATGATSVVGTNGATFYITGVQLEQNTSATPFERRLYNQELANCQRYWQQSYSAGTVAGAATQVGAADILPGTNGTGTMGGFSYFRVEMRAIPTVTLYDLVGASGKVYKGANGKTGALQNQSTTGFTGYTTDATSAAEMLYQWIASSEL
jgi:hypothetical protein